MITKKQQRIINLINKGKSVQEIIQITDVSLSYTYFVAKKFGLTEKLLRNNEKFKQKSINMYVLTFECPFGHKQIATKRHIWHTENGKYYGCDKCMCSHPKNKITIIGE
ncbi:MAG: hypothetical protein ACTSQS_11550 [Promethearchaeota archaeon]